MLFYVLVRWLVQISVEVEDTLTGDYCFPTGISRGSALNLATVGFFYFTSITIKQCHLKIWWCIIWVNGIVVNKLQINKWTVSLFYDVSHQGPVGKSLQCKTSHSITSRCVLIIFSHLTLHLPNCSLLPILWLILLFSFLCALYAIYIFRIPCYITNNNLLFV